MPTSSPKQVHIPTKTVDESNMIIGLLYVGPKKLSETGAEQQTQDSNVSTCDTGFPGASNKELSVLVV